MKYLIIFEDGTGKQTDDNLTADLLQNVDDGVIEVIRFENGQFEFVSTDGEWKTIETTGESDGSN